MGTSADHRCIGHASATQALGLCRTTHALPEGSPGVGSCSAPLSQHLGSWHSRVHAPDQSDADDLAHNASAERLAFASGSTQECPALLDQFITKKVELRNGIPIFLGQLGDALRLAKSSATIAHYELDKAAGRHGGDLHRMGLTIGRSIVTTHPLPGWSTTLISPPFALAVRQGAPLLLPPADRRLT